MSLSDTAIRNVKGTGKPQKLADGEGLHLYVSPSGGKLWRMAYRFHKKEKTLSFGAYPHVSLADARKRKDEAKALLAAGVDPSQAKKEAKAAGALSAATTFNSVAAEYLDKQKREGRSAATLSKLQWLFSLAAPEIGHRPIAEIKSPEILAVLQRSERRGNLETAKRLRGTIGAVIRYAIASGRASLDPTGSLKGAVSAPKVKHRPAITEPVPFGGLLRAIDGFTGQPATMAALKLLPLVFTRPSELRLAKWTEFDLAAAVWTIPAERTKMRREHRVPLARQALAILKDIQPITVQGPLVFPGTRSAHRAISENTLNAALRRLGYGKDEVVSHGFRATASTRLNESNRFASDAIERALGHQDPNAVRRAYARGEFWKERVEMMQWWADYCDTLKTGGEVVPFSTVRVHKL